MSEQTKQTPAFDVRALAVVGAFRAADVQLAGLLERRTGDDCPWAHLAAATTSLALREGGTRVVLTERVARPLLDERGEVALAAFGSEDTDNLQWPDPDQWMQALREHRTRTPSSFLEVTEDGVSFQRFSEMEAQVAADLVARSQALTDAGDGRPRPPSPTALRDKLSRADVSGGAAVAIATACLRGLCVLTGGPGTGKTTTVARLLETLHLLGAFDDARRVLLLAPTGKAAARLAESLEETWADRIAEAVEGGKHDPLLGTRFRASTIHKAVGMRPGRAPRFDSGNPLGVDLVIVDEVSMVDLPLMATMLRALPRSARLVLVGDPNQLNSVEVGTVLRDIRDAGRLAVSRPWTNQLAELLGTPTASISSGRSVESEPCFGDAHVELTHTWRFGSTIRALAEATLRAAEPGSGAETGDVLALLRGELSPAALLDRLSLGDATNDTDGAGTIEWMEIPEGAEELPTLAVTEIATALRPSATAAVADGTNEERARAALGGRDAARALCAVRRGPFGIEAITDRVPPRLTDVLDLPRRSGRDTPHRAALYAGLPVLVTRNDYEAELMNGDLGVAVQHNVDDTESVRVWFVPPSPDGLPTDAPRRARPFSTGALPEWQPAWALTIHKSQGSQFDHVFVVLPADEQHVLLSRELLYTAITRAKRRVTVVATEAALRQAVETSVQRAGGLGERLCF